MADLSLKATAASCLGMTPPFSVNSDVYGYIFRDENGTLFGGTPQPRSLRQQLELMKGKAINICIFLIVQRLRNADARRSYPYNRRFRSSETFTARHRSVSGNSSGNASALRRRWTI